MKKSKILIIALVAVVIALGAGALLIFSDNIGLTYAHADMYTAGETTLTEKVENLDVNWKSGNIVIEYNSSNEIRVTETGNRTISGDDEMRWWLDGTTLRIQYAKSGRFRLFDTLNKTLTISMPQGIVLNTAKIHTTSGDMDIPALAADSAELTVTSGNVKAAADVRAITVSATSGDLDVTLAGKTDDVTIRVTSGKITANLADVKRASVKSTSGNITVSGRVGEADISATSGKINVRFDAFSKLNIDVTSGDVHAELPEEPGFTCETKVTSGDINYRGFSKVDKGGNTYTFGKGENTCSIKTTSGNIEIIKLN